MIKTHEPIRTCVVCRAKFSKFELLRFCQKSGEFAPRADCRSFYVCQNCAQKDDKELNKRLSRFKLDALKLKEIFCLQSKK